MTALPSIVAGLFIYSVFIVALGVPRVRAGRVAGDRRDDAADHRPCRRRRAPGRAGRPARGRPRRSARAAGATVWHVVLPTARPGLATAVILASPAASARPARCCSPAASSTFLVTNPTGGVMNSLPLSSSPASAAASRAPIARGVRRRRPCCSVLVLIALRHRAAAAPARRARQAAAAAPHPAPAGPARRPRAHGPHRCPLPLDRGPHDEPRPPHVPLLLRPSPSRSAW